MIKVPNNRQMFTEEKLDEYYEGWLNKLNLKKSKLWMIVPVIPMRTKKRYKEETHPGFKD